MYRRRIDRFALAVVPALLLAACAPHEAVRPGLPATMAQTSRASSAAMQPDKKQKIQHVVVIVQENRSFDNLFQGYPGANTVSSGLNSKGQTITLQPIGLEVNWGLDHRSGAMFAACDGDPPGENCKMDGFDKESVQGQKPPPNPQYGYVPPNESAPYFAIANEFVVADDMFASQLDASFVSHQYIIAGQANHAVDLPLDQWGCGGGPSDTVETLEKNRSYGPARPPCFESNTIGDELDAKGLAWRYYAPENGQNGYEWSAYQAIGHIYNGPDWTNDVISPPSQFLSDVQNGVLGAVTWIVPTCANSDHSGCMSNTGPAWVAGLVNAVGESQFWKTTTVVVMWDEWGGWYDHVPPPYADYDGLGFRVPLLVISPYAKQGYVSHVQYEHGSILRYIEDTFGLKRLAASDRRANSIAPDCLDFHQRPRKFAPIEADYSLDYFLRRQPPDRRAPDDA